MANRSNPELIATVSTAVVGIGSLVLSYIKWVVPWFSDRKRESEKQLLIDGLARLRVAFVSMESLLQFPDVGRVILFAAHDSGGLPRIGSPFYTSAIHWAVSFAKRESLADYKMIPLDGHYIQVLLDLKEKDHRVIVTADLPPCLLKDYYEVEDVSSSLLVFIGIREARFLYVSISKFHGASFSREEITRSIRRVRSIRTALLTEGHLGQTEIISDTDLDLDTTHENK